VPTVSDLIAQEAARRGVDPSLAIQVAAAESGLDPNVPDSSAGAIGVFQLEPATAAALGVNPRDLAQNISGGVRYLAQLLGQFGGSIPAALAAYNWGPGNLRNAIAKWGSDWISHLPAETTSYVARIIRNLGLSLPTQAVTTPAGAPPSDSVTSTPDEAAAGPVPPPPGNSTMIGVGIVAAIAVGVYLLAEVFND